MCTCVRDLACASGPSTELYSMPALGYGLRGLSEQRAERERQTERERERPRARTERSFGMFGYVSMCVHLSGVRARGPKARARGGHTNAHPLQRALVGDRASAHTTHKISQSRELLHADSARDDEFLCAVAGVRHVLTSCARSATAYHPYEQARTSASDSAELCS